MSHTWQEEPPYPNWKDFAPHLAEYAADRIREHGLPHGANFAAWFAENEAAMRARSTGRGTPPSRPRFSPCLKPIRKRGMRSSN